MRGLYHRHPRYSILPWAVLGQTVMRWPASQEGQAWESRLLGAVRTGEMQEIGIVRVRGSGNAMRIGPPSRAWAPLLFPLASTAAPTGEITEGGAWNGIHSP